MFKKLIPIILAILLLAACSQSEVALLEFIDTSPIVYNYDGKTIIMDGGPYFHYQDDNSPQTDALRQRLANIQKELNLTFEYCEKGRTTIASIIGDVYTADIIYRWEGSSLVDFAYSNVLYPMTDFPEFIDLSDTDKYGTPGATEAALAKGIPYGIQPTYWPGMQGTECFFHHVQ